MASHPEMSVETIALQGLRLTRQLRASMLDVLFEATPEPTATDYMEDSSTPPLDMTLIKRLTDRVQESFESLEKLVSVLPKQNIVALQNNSHILSSNQSSGIAEPAADELLSSYAWVKKIHEYSLMGHVFLNQHVKRATRFTKKPITQFITFPAEVMTSMARTFDKQFGDVKLIQTGRNTFVMFITVPNVMKVAVVFRGVLLDWCNVKGIQESFYNHNDKLDIRSRSQLVTFQKVSDHVKGALLNFADSQLNVMPQFALRSFIQWLMSYKNLFNEPCATCKHILKQLMPPLCRDIRSTTPYHEKCRP